MTRQVARSKPVLVKDGKKTFISTHGWSDLAVLTYIQEAPSNTWIDLGDIARIAYGQNNQSGRDRVRRNIPKLFRFALFGHQIFLVTEVEGKHDKVKAIKVLDQTAENEVARAKVKLERMHKRKELSDEMYYHAMRIFNPKR